MSDAELVARARQGDTAAFGELVDRHRAAVYRAAHAALGSASEAEDVAQEAFLAAYRKMATYRGEASFKTWREQTYREMAAVLGIPEGTLKWRVTEARRRLKQRLTALGYGND